MFDTLVHQEYPVKDGDVTVLGPEVFASQDGAVICWRGENYVRQDARVKSLGVLALQIEGIADRLAAVPVQGEDAATVRRAAQAIRAASDETRPS